MATNFPISIDALIILVHGEKNIGEQWLVDLLKGKNMLSFFYFEEDLIP